MVDGTVKLWNDDEGWGVLISPEVPGEVWAHFSHIAIGDETGYRTLADGDRVRFDYEHYRSGQDGYVWRAKRIVPRDGEFARLSDQEIEQRIKDFEEERAGSDSSTYEVTTRLE